MYAISPLRYPGAKWRLEAFISSLLKLNRIDGGHYAEPYAGGCSLALSLLFSEQVKEIHLNDLDRSIYAFWKSVTEYSSELIERIHATEINIETWREQKEIQKNKRTASIVELGFSTFFLNRTNRSGILNAGVIGGKAQLGKWRIDARFHKQHLIERVQKIATFKSRIHVTKLDALDFVRRRGASLPAKSFLYLDPPYFVKGQELYLNSYRPADHARVAEVVLGTVGIPWMVSYDDTTEIRALYKTARKEKYELRYSASLSRKGNEIIFLSPGLRINKALLGKV